MRIYFESLGCRLNEAELASWARAVRQRGGRVVARPQLADVMVLNTCAVTAEAARKSRKLTGRLHRTNPAAKLVLTGCLAALQPEQAAELAGVDLVLGNRDKEQLLDLVQAQLGLDLADADTSCDRPEAAAPRTRAFVKVQDGCHNRCTFCIVTVARGPERSKPIDALVDELNRLHADGSQEVVLTGVHLGGYGSDLGTNLQQLVEQLLLRTAILGFAFHRWSPGRSRPTSGRCGTTAGSAHTCTYRCKAAQTRSCAAWRGAAAWPATSTWSIGRGRRSPIWC